MEVTAVPTSSTMPQYSCPIGVAWGTGLIPRYGHRSEPHTQVAEFLTIASVGFRIAGMSRSSKRKSRGPQSTAPRITYLLLFLSSVFSHGLAGLLVMLVPLLLNVRLVNLLCPILRPNFFDRDRNGLFSVMQNAHHVFRDGFCEMRFLLF